MRPKKDVPLRSDAQRNRARILDVALAELTLRPDVPLSVIARKACVGQATFYRNFPDRASLILEVYQHEMGQVADAATELLCCLAPDRALRAWMDRLTEFAMAKAGLTEALRLAVTTGGGPQKPPPTPLMEAADLLLRAAEEAGTIRPGVTADDFLLATAGLWQLTPDGEWRATAERLLDLVMDGLRAGAAGR
ncbi:TetR/AcrR family transcriptional regulator [Streptomyces sp. NPDC093085]|uniref:TetR/AcrR family transcriptional regulator n=1 Tax=Streptomyces sp. NPDC093085 TaxID=3155068 RepID=UPI003412C7F9